MNKLIIALAFFFMGRAAYAEDYAQPFLYSTETLKLIPKPELTILTPLPASKFVPLEDKKEPKNELPTTKDSAKKADDAKNQSASASSQAIIKDPEPAKPPPRTPIDFTVEVKPPAFLAQDDFISQNLFGEHEGLLILVDPAGEATLTATRMVETSDVLFINEDGLITKIAPNLVIADLQEPISSGAHTRAMLFIKAGSVEQDRIVIGDHFENAMFKTHPVILQ